MKLVTITLLGILWVCAGCGTTRQLEAPQTELIHMSLLPSLDPFTYKDHVTLSVLFCVLQDGRIADVRILGTSGNRDWDAAARDSMRQWRFSAVVGDCPAEGIWVRNSVVVRAEEHLVMSLGELLASDKKEADSLYALLERGVPFESLLERATTTFSPSGMILGPTDIAQYPGRVREELRRLKVGGFTRPIRVGANFTIYKRFNHEPVHRLVQ